jgi:hypothetical protein
LVVKPGTAELDDEQRSWRPSARLLVSRKSERVRRAGHVRELTSETTKDDVQASRACEAVLPLRLAEASVRSLSGGKFGNRPERQRRIRFLARSIDVGSRLTREIKER